MKILVLISRTLFQLEQINNFVRDQTDFNRNLLIKLFLTWTCLVLASVIPYVLAFIRKEIINYIHFLHNLNKKLL